MSAVPKVKGDESSQKEVKKLTHESETAKKSGDRPKKPENSNKGKSSKGKGQDRGKGKGKGKKTPPPAGKKQTKWENGMTDELLMTQSLRRDLEKEL